MKQMKNKKERGITLIALVVTIIVLIVLAGISINLIFGNLGIVTKEKEAKEENLKQTAKEVMNLKITSIQIENYTENKTLPSLQFLADKLCEDNDMEYVLTQSKAHASLDKIDTTNLSSIYTKLKEYPYEFEINDSLQLASIDGVKVAQTDDTKESFTKQEVQNMINSALENNIEYDLTGAEHVVGKIVEEDGTKKNLYEKTIVVTGPSESNKWVGTNHNIQNIDEIFEIKGTALLDNGYYRSVDSVSSGVYLCSVANKNEISIATNYERAKNRPWTITIKYTKTTDTTQTE